MPLTEAQKRALTIVRDYHEKHRHPIRPTEFSKLMWPDSEGHHRHTKCGPSGVSHGGGMRLAAGGYLGKLRKAGLVTYTWSRYDGNGYVLSKDGKEALLAEEQ